MQCEMGLINPDMMRTTSIIYMMVPYGVEQVSISWQVLSKRYKQDGKMIVDVKPEYEYEIIEDSAKACTDEIIPYKEYQ